MMEGQERCSGLRLKNLEDLLSDSAEKENRGREEACGKWSIAANTKGSQSPLPILPKPVSAGKATDCKETNISKATRNNSESSATVGVNNYIKSHLKDGVEKAKTDCKSASPPSTSVPILQKSTSQQKEGGSSPSLSPSPSAKTNNNNRGSEAERNREKYISVINE